MVLPDFSLSLSWSQSWPRVPAIAGFTSLIHCSQLLVRTSADTGISRKEGPDKPSPDVDFIVRASRKIQCCKDEESEDRSQSHYEGRM